MEKYLKYEAPFGTLEVCFDLEQYAMGKTLAIDLLVKEDDGLDDFGSLTVNLKESHGFDEVFIDTNNIPGAEKFIHDNELGELIGYGFSGFTSYPLYKLDMQKIKEYSVNPEFFEEELK